MVMFLALHPMECISSNGGHSGVIVLSLKRTFQAKNDPRDAFPGKLE